LEPAQTPEEAQMLPMPVPPGSVPIAKQTVEIPAEGDCSNSDGTEALGSMPHREESSVTIQKLMRVRFRLSADVLSLVIYSSEAIAKQFIQSQDLIKSNASLKLLKIMKDRTPLESECQKLLLGKTSVSISNHMIQDALKQGTKTSKDVKLSPKDHAVSLRCMTSECTSDPIYDANAIKENKFADLVDLTVDLDSSNSMSSVRSTSVEESTGKRRYANDCIHIEINGASRRQPICAETGSNETRHCQSINQRHVNVSTSSQSRISSAAVFVLEQFTGSDHNIVNFVFDRKAVKESAVIHYRQTKVVDGNVFTILLRSLAWNTFFLTTDSSIATAVRNEHFKSCMNILAPKKSNHCKVYGIGIILITKEQ
ncbi:uncharacterized protein DEA37_0009018, partial [Paragonimus westermani]